ncbi:hypothetical protein B1J92_L03388g [Nakaseomyces glabratus]|nr:hypothetical protein B1J91_L03388g [Nakaseomyces glabratus]OXB46363.1 hypothetical protein B1J92_L03388g [Nakaseomyces glabratus]
MYGVFSVRVRGTNPNTLNMSTSRKPARLSKHGQAQKYLQVEPSSLGKVRYFGNLPRLPVSSYVEHALPSETGAGVHLFGRKVMSLCSGFAMFLPEPPGEWKRFAMR